MHAYDVLFIILFVLVKWLNNAEDIICCKALSYSSAGCTFHPDVQLHPPKKGGEYACSMKTIYLLMGRPKYYSVFIFMKLDASVVINSLLHVYVCSVSIIAGTRELAIGYFCNFFWKLNVNLNRSSYNFYLSKYALWLYFYFFHFTHSVPVIFLYLSFRVLLSVSCTFFIMLPCLCQWDIDDLHRLFFFFFFLV